MSEFRNEAQRKATYKLSSVPLAGLIWVATCLIIVFYIFTLIPPKTVEQLGYRGVAMENIQNVRTVKARDLVNQPPDEWPPFPADGPLASDVYENVPALGHLTQANFDRMMTLITEWVSPAEGCNYCHVVNEDGGVDYVSDDIYTKVVSRRMVQMTQHINAVWSDHVAPSGVNCYTCHRGNPVPTEIWFDNPEPVESAREGAGNRFGQNAPDPLAAYSSLPNDALSIHLKEMDQGLGDIRVVPTTALPTEWKLEPDLKDGEVTYGLMMHISEALGTNCTYCHNSRAFVEWYPTRVTAWYGIRMNQDLNQNFLIPLQPEYPAMRLGALGDAPKANCATCHQAVNFPLNRADMISAYPSLAAPATEGTDLRAASYKFVTTAPAEDPAAAEAAPAEEAAAEDPAAAEAAPAEEAAAEEPAAAEAAPAEDAAAEDPAAAEAAPAEDAAAEDPAAAEAAPAEDAAAEEPAAAEAAPAEEAAAEEPAATEAAPAEEAAAEEPAAAEAAPAEDAAAEDPAAAEAAPAEDAAAEEPAAAEAAPAEEAAAEEPAAAEAAPAEEAAAEEPAAAEAAPAEEAAAEEPAAAEAAPAEEAAAEDPAAAEAAPAEEAAAAEEPAAAEAAPAEEAAAAEEPAAAEAAPAEEAAAEEPAVAEAAPAEEAAAEEPAATEAAPAEEAAAEEPAAAEAAPAEEAAAEEPAAAEAAPAEEAAAEEPAAAEAAPAEEAAAEDPVAPDAAAEDETVTEAPADDAAAEVEQAAAAQ
ncbi:photosynthetic reaction center cytochrome PufC [Roseospira goensis]|uniref:Photosynthetic reaction center cytochrome c subunit n=1 Tax=Roseospira goensis TaxID=391922 RepID=A0A7W6WKH5_9PROT|nr:photosynthetic reaction center cytochrome PufC [Roseospira goensis]MBB4285452.1 hypothetical protein [Roseospira goensis]